MARLSVEELGALSFPAEGNDAFEEAYGHHGVVVSQPLLQLVGEGRNEKYVRECTELYLGGKGERPPRRGRRRPLTRPAAPCRHSGDPGLWAAGEWRARARGGRRG